MEYDFTQEQQSFILRKVWHEYNFYWLLQFVRLISHIDCVPSCSGLAVILKLFLNHLFEVHMFDQQADLQYNPSHSLVSQYPNLLCFVIGCTLHTSDEDQYLLLYRLLMIIIMLFQLDFLLLRHLSTPFHCATTLFCFEVQIYRFSISLLF